MLIIIDNYDSFTYNLAQYFGEQGADVRVFRNDDITVSDIEAKNPKAIVISPGPCTPNEAGISLDVATMFAGKIPMLGVCLGHQSIAQAFGAKIVRADVIMHGKTSEVFHDRTGLFKNLDNPIIATRYHSLIVDKPSLPKSLRVTAKTWDENIMGLELVDPPHGQAPVWGVQFHPESIMTIAGKQIVSNFMKTVEHG